MIHRKRLLVLAAATAVVAAACGSSDGGSSSATTKAEGSATTAGGSASSGDGLAGGRIKCEQQFKGKKVEIFSPVRDSETDKAATRLKDTYKPLVDCTGVEIVFTGTDQFETEIKVKMAGGNPPDVIDFPQPGGLRDLIAKKQAVPFPDDLAKMVKDENLAGWPELATVDGKTYGVPARANIKSLVWYSPAAFKAKGYEIPKTLDDMKALSDKIVADGGTPWCVGIESGVATGWVITDWFEDMMLRINGPEVYDQWVAHQIPFNDPKVKAVADAVGSYVKNPKYIGSENAVKAIASTKFQEGGFPILENKCYMHRQASFYSTIWPKGTTIGADGQVNYFYLPVKAGDPKYMLGGGDLIAAGTDKPETFAVLTYTGSLQYQTDLVKNGDTSLSTRKDFDTTVFADPTTKGFADLLKASDVFRFDGADMMPAAIGSGKFWTEATAWILGGSTDDFLNNVEDAWKKLPPA